MHRQEQLFRELIYSISFRICRCCESLCFKDQGAKTQQLRFERMFEMKLFTPMSDPILCQGKEYETWLCRSCGGKLGACLDPEKPSSTFPAGARCNNLNVESCPEAIQALTPYERQ